MQSNGCRKIADPKCKEANFQRGEATKEVRGCAGTPGKEPLISEKEKQTRMVKAKGIMESSKSKKGKRKRILQPRDNTLLTLLTTSRLFAGVFCNKLCSQCLCSHGFRTTRGFPFPTNKSFSRAPRHPKRAVIS